MPTEHCTLATQRTGMTTVNKLRTAPEVAVTCTTTGFHSGNCAPSPKKRWHVADTFNDVTGSSGCANSSSDAPNAVIVSECRPLSPTVRPCQHTSTSLVFAMNDECC